MIRFVFILSAILLSSSEMVHAENFVESANTAKASAACANALQSDAETDALLDSPDPMLLISPDAATNLFVNHPSNIMSARQYGYSLVLSGGTTTTFNARATTGSVPVYQVFNGHPMAGPGKIIGNHIAIEQIMQNLRSGAEGNRSAISTVPLLEGPPGTAKSELLHKLRTYSTAQSLLNPDFYIYTHVFHDLTGLGLDTRLNTTGVEGEIPEFECPMHDSPFALLPTSYQNNALALANEKVKSLTNGISAAPKRKPCQQCGDIKDRIIKSLRKKLGRKPNDEEIASDILKRIRLQRVVLGAPGTAPKLDAQGQEPDYAALFGAPRPMVRNEFGPTDAWAIFINGAFHSGNRFMTMVDELFRNIPPLRDKFLNIFESGRVETGGTNTDVDSWYIAASNSESILKAIKEGGSWAQIDRMLRIQFNWSTQPHQVAQTMLMMNGADVSARKLEVDTEGNSVANEPFKVTSENLETLFPLPAAPKRANDLVRFEGPDGRFDLFTGDSHISPHTVLFMGELISATRLELDPAKAGKFGVPLNVLNESAFKDPVERLRIEMGEVPLLAAQRKELLEITARLREGETGISARDVGRLWSEVATEAKTAPEGNCINPIIVERIFERMLANGQIKIPDPVAKTNAHWENLLEIVKYKLLVPAIQRDVYSALGGAQTDMNGAYDAVVSEIKALAADSSARSHTFMNNEFSIDFDRLEAIKRFYYIANGKIPLDINKIGSMHQDFARVAGDSMKTVRHPVLMSAIEQYYADLMLRTVSLDQLLIAQANGKGNPTVRQAYSQLADSLKKKGYCFNCLKQALAILHNARAKAAEPEHSVANN